MSLNSVVVIGRLTKDPEERVTASGTPVCSFCLAVENGYGEKKRTDFLDCVAWSKTAEFIGNYFSKGQRILLQGHIQTRTWQDKEGKNRKAVEVIADRAGFVDLKRDSGGARGDVAAVPGPGYDEFEMMESGGDLPF